MADENNKTYKKYFLCLRRNTYIGAPKVLREQEFEGSDRLRSPSDLIGPVRRNPWALEIRFAPDAASNVLNFLNLLFTSWIFDS